MKTDEEKAELRSALGMLFFLRLADGLCPYCEKPLETECRFSANAPSELIFCNDCGSGFTPPEFGSGDDGPDLNDGSSGMNRAQRRRAQAQQRKVRR